MQKVEAEKKLVQDERKKELEKLLAEKKTLENHITETVQQLERLKQSKEDIRTKQENSIAKITEEVSCTLPTLLNSP